MATRANPSDHYEIPHHAKSLDLGILVPSLEANPYVKKFVCPSGLIGFTYSDITKITWDPHTLAARGIILEQDSSGDYSLVALPFPKFENYGKGGEVRAAPESVTAKLDGALGIIFWHEKQGRWRVATRGAFAERSPAAAWAEKVLEDSHSGWSEGDKAYTYLVEILSPETFVVVPYPEDTHGLTLLAAYHLPSGKELRREPLAAHAERLSVTLVEEAPASLSDVESLLASTKTMDGLVQEGWVVRFANGERRKFKADDYKRLHRVFSGFNPMDLWVNLSSSDAPREALHRILLVLPDEFHDEAKALALPWIEEVESKMAELKVKMEPFIDTPGDPSLKREIGMGMKSKALPPYAMAYFLEKSDVVRAALWGPFRPKA